MVKPHWYLCVFSLLFLSLSGFAQGSGNTLSFDGNSTFVDLGDEVAGNCRTVEFWFKLTENIDINNADVITFIARDFNNADGASTNEFGFFIEPSTWLHPGQLTFSRRIGSTSHSVSTFTNTWSANQWYHVAGVIDETFGMRLYINGVLQGQTTTSTAPIQVQSGNNSDRVSIGRWGNLNIRYFEGEIDDLRFWTSTRSETQIRDRMCSKLGTDVAGLKAHYSFDQESGNTLTDQSGNSFDGSIYSTGSANWTVSGAPIGDVSIQLYVNSLPAQSLRLTVEPNHFFEINNVIVSAEGAHVYYVDEAPNTNNGFDQLLPNGYFGVFLSNESGLYEIHYDFSGYECGSCANLVSRNDNSGNQWFSLQSNPPECIVTATGESSIGDSHRGEYLISALAPALDLGADVSLCADETLELDVGHVSGTYTWDDGSTERVRTIATSGTYWVEIQTTCAVLSDTLVVSYETFCECPVYFPEAFTPNADGLNDWFSPISNCDFQSYQFTIYDRWMNEVFVSHSASEAWDGQFGGGPAQEGVYAYVLRYVDREKRLLQKKGSVVLAR